MKIFRVARSTLLAKTTLLLLQSLAMFVVGIVLYNRPDLVNHSLDFAQSQLGDLSSKVGAAADNASIKLEPFIEPVAFVVMIVGGVASAVFILGMVVSKSENALLTAIYLLAVLAMLYTVLIVMAAFFWNKPTVKDIIRPGLHRTIVDYVGDESNQSTSVTWNAMMYMLNCCGVNNYQDFKELKNWQPLQTKHNVTRELLTPVVCCKERTGNISCALKGTASHNNNWATRGCLDTIVMYLTTNLQVILFLLLLLLQLLLIAATTVFILTDLVVDSLIPL